MDANKAILIDCSPKLKCCVFSMDYGPICVSSFDDQTGLLDVDSISLLGINPFATRSDQSNMIDHVYEGFLFRNDNHGGQRDSQLDRHQRNFMEEVSLIKGLRERLLDSSRIHANANSDTAEAHTPIERSSIFSTQKTNRYLPFRTFDRSKRRRIIEFVNKSEAVIGELLSAHDQFRRQQKNNSAITIEQGKSLGFSEEYFEGLYYNVGQVQTLLDSTPGDRHYVELNDKLTKVSIHFFDEKGREHNLVGELPPQFPSNPPTWTCDLPIDFVPQWKIVSKASHESSASSLSGGGLYDCVALFIELVSSYQLLWNELEDLDTNLWVIDPPLPARFSCTNRRIMIKPGLSTVISLEPENPRAIPLSMRLIGSGSEIEKYRTQYELYTSARYPQQHINFQESLWCEQQSIRFNLETCFQCSLPKSQISNDGVNKIECAICYSHSLSRHGDSDEIPNVKCSNSSCARYYHQSCLIEWIRSIPGSKFSFGRIFGSCPYCYETISVLID